MADPMYPSVTTTSRKPMFERCDTRCWMDGRLTIGIQGFGRSNVRGRRRVPSPPHIMHTFIVHVWCWRVLRIMLEMERQENPLPLTGKFPFYAYPAHTGVHGVSHHHD